MLLRQSNNRLNRRLFDFRIYKRSAGSIPINKVFSEIMNDDENQLDVVLINLFNNHGFLQEEVFH